MSIFLWNSLIHFNFQFWKKNREITLLTQTRWSFYICFNSSAYDRKPNLKNDFFCLLFQRVAIWKRNLKLQSKQRNWLFTFGFWSPTDLTKQTLKLQWNIYLNFPLFVFSSFVFCPIFKIKLYSNSISQIRASSILDKYWHSIIWQLFSSKYALSTYIEDLIGLFCEKIAFVLQTY